MGRNGKKILNMPNQCVKSSQRDCLLWAHLFRLPAFRLFFRLDENQHLIVFCQSTSINLRPPPIWFQVKRYLLIRKLYHHAYGGVLALNRSIRFNQYCFDNRLSISQLLQVFGLIVQVHKDILFIEWTLMGFPWSQI